MNHLKQLLNQPINIICATLLDDNLNYKKAFLSHNLQDY